MGTFALLGRVGVIAPGGTAVELRGGQARLAFAVLVTNRRHAVSRDELAWAMWGDDPPASWRSALRVVISRVRSYLARSGAGGIQLAHESGAYRLVADGDWTVDVEDAELAVQRAEDALARKDDHDAALLAARAAAVLRDPFVPDAAGPWVDDRSRHLVSVRLRALLTQSTACARLGRHGEAVDAAQQAIDTDPYDERSHRCLMEAHAAAGNRPAALAAYGVCRRILDDELGVVPSPTTQSLYRRLLGPADVSSALDPWGLEIQRAGIANGSGVGVEAETFAYALAAGRSALERGAPGDASAWLRRALAVRQRRDPLRCRTLLELANALARGGQPAERDRVLREAVELARSLGEADLLGAAALAGDPGWATRPHEVNVERVSLIEEALAAGGVAPTARRAQLLVVLASELTFGGPWERRWQLCADALSIAQEVGTPAALLAVRLLRCQALWAPPSLAERGHDAVAAHELAVRLGDDTARAHAAWMRAVVALEAGDVVTCDRWATEAVDLSTRLSNPSLVWGVLMHGSWRQVLAGDLEHAVALADTALALGRDLDVHLAGITYLSQSIALHWLRGELVAVLPSVDRLPPNVRRAPVFTAVRAAGAAAAGDREVAASLLHEYAARRFCSVPFDQRWFVTMLFFAEAAARLGDRDAAAAVHELLVPYDGRIVFDGVAVYGPVADVLRRLEAVLSGSPSAPVPAAPTTARS